MKITKDEVNYIAHLARLDFTESEGEKIASQLNDILMYIEKLNEVNTNGIEPLSHCVILDNTFREDIVRESLQPSQSLSNAPETRGNFFRVPKIIE